LCEEHYELLNDPEVVDPAIIVDAAVARMAEIPQVRKVLGKLSGFLDQFGGAFDRRSNFEPEPEFEEVDHHPPPRGHQQPPPPRRPQPPPRQAPPREDPRMVLGFPAQTKLTREAIKTRHRELSALFHPDKGGSLEAQQRITAARDALLKTL
jgi:hypothetical protein